MEKNFHKFSEEFIKNYDENRICILEVDLEYPKNLRNVHSDLPFLVERMKINNCNKLVCNRYDNSKYVVHTRILKQALNQRLILKEVHRVIQFNKDAWLKPCIY